MRSVLLRLAACAILGGCAAYDAPYAPGYGYGYPPAVGYGYPPPVGYGYPPPVGYYGYGYYYGEPLLLDGRPAYRHRDRDGRHDGRPGRGGGRRDVDGSGGSGWSPGNEPGALGTPSGSGGSGWSPADIGKPGR